MFRGQDMSGVLNINSQIPPYLLEKFCVDMKGKEINLDMRVQMKEFDEKKLKDMNQNEIRKIAEFWHQYPFYEAYMIEEDAIEGEDDK